MVALPAGVVENIGIAPGPIDAVWGVPVLLVPVVEDRDVESELSTEPVDGPD